MGYNKEHYKIKTIAIQRAKLILAIDSNEYNSAYYKAKIIGNNQGNDETLEKLESVIADPDNESKEDYLKDLVPYLDPIKWARSKCKEMGEEGVKLYKDILRGLEREIEYQHLILLLEEYGN